MAYAALAFALAAFAIAVLLTTDVMTDAWLPAWYISMIGVVVTTTWVAVQARRQRDKHNDSSASHS